MDAAALASLDHQDVDKPPKQQERTLTDYIVYGLAILGLLYVIQQCNSRNVRTDTTTSTRISTPALRPTPWCPTDLNEADYSACQDALANAVEDANNADMEQTKARDDAAMDAEMQNPRPDPPEPDGTYP